MNRLFDATSRPCFLWIPTLSCLLLVIQMTGCPTRRNEPNSDSPQIGVEWRCDNSEMIWVDGMTGFGRTLRCGQLGGPALSTIVIFPQTTIPEEVTVTWWRGGPSVPDQAGVQKSTILVSPLEVSEETPLLVLTFNEKQEWGADWNALRD